MKELEHVRDMRDMREMRDVRDVREMRDMKKMREVEEVRFGGAIAWQALSFVPLAEGDRRFAARWRCLL